jgi:hypothetical protein
MERNINPIKFLKLKVQKHKNLYFSHTQLITTHVLNIACLIIKFGTTKKKFYNRVTIVALKTNEEILIKRIVYLW